MAKLISDYTNADELRIVMTNAKKLQREDIWREAFSRLCSIEAGDQEDPLYQDFYATLAAYEELLAEKNGQKDGELTMFAEKLRTRELLSALRIGQQAEKSQMVSNC